ncbi:MULTISPECIES: phosphohydrolase [unclassified Marinobacter]|jgi:HD superfamily phosphohydrolase|uniref:HD domain-containing protein n=1 Tax=unclassified Marinobacter TaxID=83889 RepID=UPI00201021A9|nr:MULTISPECIES: phosphohydrolase [unclassified Marinobacter]MCL1476170.1 phosphohydrolase [Marinobacter sp.]MCL1482722.1 phosphohydrolase [Marinobacter sp.]MCL1482921.1 phosphohydrolase [Marinobacter sp.]UQG54060.1 phosphohydrolase [Marinobacter sp. M4C]UQG62867.1 phosphohydrolase [Marinobacter sp. M2C]
MRRAVNDLLGAYDKLIMDPVHGAIPLYRHEIQVIDHPLFQRLRNICQNDILSLVFPGATHSRFLHSIGVMHVGTRMFRAMIDAYLRERQLSEQNDLTLSQLDAIDFLAKTIRLGCLLHDSGHSSFSHQFTQARHIRELMSRPGRFEDLWADVDFTQYHPQPPEELEHEHYSVRVAHDVLWATDLAAAGLNAADVIGIMETTEVKPSPTFCKHAVTFWEFIAGADAHGGAIVEDDIPGMVMNLLSSIVSGEIDADRADYMLRDGFHSSVTIGGFNLDHLLSNLRFGWNPHEPWLGLAITQKGLGALEDFVYSRYQMYRKVYAHKTALGFDWLLREAINEVLDDEESFHWIDTCLSNMQWFAELTDNFFWEAFRKVARRQPESFSFCIVNRVKLQHLDTREDLNPDAIAQHSHWLAGQLALNPANVVTCSMYARFSNIQDNFNGIKVLMRNPVNRRRSLQKITDVSAFFSKFGDGIITHFYTRPFTPAPIHQ